MIVGLAFFIFVLLLGMLGVLPWILETVDSEVGGWQASCLFVVVTMFLMVSSAMLIMFLKMNDYVPR
jgi:hypothetical protein